MLFLKVNGKLPGSVLEAAGEATVQVEALSSGELEKIEIVVDGAPVKTFPGAGRRVAGAARVRPQPGGWVAARCFEKSSVTVRFAHTSPVYWGRNPRRAAEARARLRAWIDADMERLEKLSGLTQAARGELLELSRKARAAFE
jgi:hypothetical protein